MKKTDDPIVVRHLFQESKGTIWKAITEREEMVKWFFSQITAFKPKEGFETRFVVWNEERKFTHLWKITDVLPYQRLTYNWKYEGYPGDSFVTFVLRQEPKGCELILTHRVTEDFPDNVPEFTRKSCIEGWEWFIKNRLKAYLE